MPKNPLPHRAVSAELKEVIQKTKADTVQKLKHERDEIYNVADYQSKVIWVEISEILSRIEKLPKTTEELMFTCARLSNLWAQLQRYKTDKAVIKQKLKEAEHASTS